MSQLVSVNADGTDSGNHRSHDPDLSADGTKVAFVTDASDLGPTDTNGYPDVYVRDLTTGVTTLVSVNAAGTDSGNGGSGGWPQISADGTKVAFSSGATDLLSPALESGGGVHVRDLVAGTTTLATVNADGTGGADRPIDGFQLSQDGTKILFGTNAGNLVPPVTAPGTYAVYERDLTAGVTTRLADGWGGRYSPSGDAVTFVNDNNIYLYERSTNAIRLVAANPSGSLVNASPVFSHDGTKVAFERMNESGYDIYVYDRVGRTTMLVTEAVDGGEGGGSPSDIQGFHLNDSNRLLFSSTGPDLVPDDTNGRNDLFVRNLAQGRTTRIAQGVGQGRTMASWVGDTSQVAFVSWLADYGVTDTNHQADVYAHDITAGTFTLVSEKATGHDGGNGDSGVFQRWEGSYLADLTVSADGSHIAFSSEASDLGPTDGNGRTDIYVASFEESTS